MHSSRRKFLKLCSAVGVAAALTIVISQFKANQSVINQASSQEENVIPQKWVMMIDLDRCDGCNDREVSICLEQCALMHYIPKRFKSSGEPAEPSEPQPWIEIFEKEDNPISGKYTLPRPCMHCESPPCLHVCPTGATFKTKDGIVLIDHRICIGCRMCMAACPYGARSFNWGDPEPWSVPDKIPPTTREDELAFAESIGGYSPEYPIPHQKGTVEKCTFCSHLAEVGGLPACVGGCPSGSLYFGDANQDMVTNGLREIVSLSSLAKERSGFRLNEEFGTKPKVIYLPKKD